MRVKGQMMDHKEIRAAMGVRIVAPGLEQAVAGTSMFVIRPEDDEEELKATVMEDMADIFSKVDRGGEGVCVQVSLNPINPVPCTTGSDEMHADGFLPHDTNFCWLVLLSGVDSRLTGGLAGVPELKGGEYSSLWHQHWPSS